MTVKFFSFISVLALLFFSCSKTENESLSPEQSFLKPFAESELPGQWQFNYYDGWEGEYHKLEFKKDGIYDADTKSYYGTGELTCQGFPWEDSPTGTKEICKGNTEFPLDLTFIGKPVKWRLQYKEGSCFFTWAFEEIEFNSIPDHIEEFMLVKGRKEYTTKWIVSDDGSITYDADVIKLN